MARVQSKLTRFRQIRGISIDRTKEELSESDVSYSLTNLAKLQARRMRVLEANSKSIGAIRALKDKMARLEADSKNMKTLIRFAGIEQQVRMEIAQSVAQQRDEVETMRETLDDLQMK